MALQAQLTPSDTQLVQFKCVWCQTEKLSRFHTLDNFSTHDWNTRLWTIAVSLTSASLLCLLGFLLSTQKPIYDHSILLRLQCLEADERAYFFSPH